MAVKQRDYVEMYLRECAEVATKINPEDVMKMTELLRTIRDEGGRLFILGVGGSAGNASHAVNDFRKIANMEAYAPTDNVSELTARVNDDGWESVFANWLIGSRLSQKDGVMVFSVGGGSVDKKVSVNLVEALKYAKKQGAKILGVVGRDGGYTATIADARVIVPTVNSETVTPHTEVFQAAIWHLIATSPDMKRQEMKWEGIK